MDSKEDSMTDEISMSVSFKYITKRDIPPTLIPPNHKVRILTSAWLIHHKLFMKKHKFIGIIFAYSDSVNRFYQHYYSVSFAVIHGSDYHNVSLWKHLKKKNDNVFANVYLGSRSRSPMYHILNN